MGFSGGMEGFLGGFSHGCRARVAEENLRFAVVGKLARNVSLHFLRFLNIEPLANTLSPISIFCFLYNLFIYLRKKFHEKISSKSLLVM